jgi:Skp family chaperone for outer membrane proteins
MPPLPVTKLAIIQQGLATSKKIAIFHQATEDGDEKVLMYPAFPKELAIAFSGYVAKAFNAVPLSQIPASEMKPKSESQVTITGGKLEAHEEVLNWILRCGQAGKTVTFRWFQSPAFHDYGMVFLSCEKLQVNVLQAQILARMQNIAAVQVHSIDVERVFSTILGPHKFKQMICQSIGQAMWDGRLKAAAAYKALFKKDQYAELKQGVDAAYDKLQRQYYKTPEGKANRKEQEERAQKAEEKDESAKQRREQKFRRSVARHHNVETANVTPTGNGGYTLSTEGRRVRKAHGAKPAFVQVDLGAMGVTAQQYRAPERRAQQQQPPRKDHPAAAASKPEVAESAAATDEASANATTTTTTTPAASNAKRSHSKGKQRVESVVASSSPPSSSDPDLADGMDSLSIGRR